MSDIQVHTVFCKSCASWRKYFYCIYRYGTSDFVETTVYARVRACVRARLIIHTNLYLCYS
jgi:hypothetical protein